MELGPCSVVRMIGQGLEPEFNILNQCLLNAMSIKAPLLAFIHAWAALIKALLLLVRFDSTMVALLTRWSHVLSVVSAYMRGTVMNQTQEKERERDKKPRTPCSYRPLVLISNFLWHRFLGPSQLF